MVAMLDHQHRQQLQLVVPLVRLEDRRSRFLPHHRDTHPLNITRHLICRPEMAAIIHHNTAAHLHHITGKEDREGLLLPAILRREECHPTEDLLPDGTVVVVATGVLLQKDAKQAN